MRQVPLQRGLWVLRDDIPDSKSIPKQIAIDVESFRISKCLRKYTVICRFWCFTTKLG